MILFKSVVSFIELIMLDLNEYFNSSSQSIIIFILSFSILSFIVYEVYQILTFNEIVVDLSESSNENGIKRFNNVNDLPPFYPNGWIAIIESKDLKINETKPVCVFGYELVVFRGTSGEVYVLDAFCPHLGANLGVGGEVVEDCGHDCIKCPFHGWTFRGRDGICTGVPQTGCSEIQTPNARIKVWDFIEMDGFVLVWHHANGEKPSWFPQKSQEIEDSKWIYRGRSEHIVNCLFQEIPENGADISHLNEVHKPAICLFPVSNKVPFYDFISKYMICEWSSNWSVCPPPNQHIASITIQNRTILFGYKLVVVNFSVQQVGPAFVQIRFKTDFLGGISGGLIQAVTPLGPMKQRVVHLTYTEPSFKAFIFSKFFIHGTARMIERDVVIWNKKKFLRKPIFTKNEKPLVKFRRWFNQFYSENTYKKLEW